MLEFLVKRQHDCPSCNEQEQGTCMSLTSVLAQLDPNAVKEIKSLDDITAYGEQLNATIEKNGKAVLTTDAGTFHLTLLP